MRKNEQESRNEAITPPHTIWPVYSESACSKLFLHSRTDEIPYHAARDISVIIHGIDCQREYFHQVVMVDTALHIPPCSVISN